MEDLSQGMTGLLKPTPATSAKATIASRILQFSTEGWLFGLCEKKDAIQASASSVPLGLSLLKSQISCGLPLLHTTKISLEISFHIWVCGGAKLMPMYLMFPLFAEVTGSQTSLPGTTLLSAGEVTKWPAHLLRNKTHNLWRDFERMHPGGDLSRKTTHSQQEDSYTE